MNEKQDIKKVLVFDVWGDYAHFRRGYTTTSPLTFPIPPRTALCGLIGALLGLEKKDNEYLKYFLLSRAKIGLRLLHPVKKVQFAENLIHTKEAKGIGMNLIVRRTQIRFEFLKDPKYRIYFWHSNSEIYNQLKKNLIEHKCVYTPCLGLSENLANFGFVDEANVEIKNYTKDISIYSILPIKKITSKERINPESFEKYFSVRVPVEFNQERTVVKYSDIIFEKDGNPIRATIEPPSYEIIYNNGTKENVVFIE